LLNHVGDEDAYPLCCEEVPSAAVAFAVPAVLAAAQNEVYLDPQDSSAPFGETTDVDIRVNATNFQSGQIKLTYSSTCADVTNWVVNTADFPNWIWNSNTPGEEWIVFVAPAFQSKTGDYLIGTLTIHCVAGEECATALDFVEDGPKTSKLFDNEGSEIPATWEDGTFACTVTTPTPTSTPTSTPTITPTPTNTPTPTPTYTPTSTPTTPTNTPTPTSTSTPTITPTPTTTPTIYRLYLPLVAKLYPPPTPTPTPTNTSTPTRTPTPTKTPKPPTPTPSCEEKICNGGFETTECWSINYGPPRPPAYSAVVVHSGSWAMRLGITSESDAKSYSSVYQMVTIPGNAASATLSFWYYPICQDAYPYDWQDVILYTQAWGFITRVMPQMCSNSQTWTHHTFDLTPYKGQTIILYCNVYNDGAGNLKTAMYLDDVSVRVCY
jgi:hypothetical protein